ncbi:MAG: hypothetical protein JWP03_5421 [Phycisphaerales bacterium]|nr:hypothetical protein [Phycisphaerales bacterium]
MAILAIFGVILVVIGGILLKRGRRPRRVAIRRIAAIATTSSILSPAGVLIISFPLSKPMRFSPMP